MVKFCIYYVRPDEVLVSFFFPRIEGMLKISEIIAINRLNLLLASCNVYEKQFIFFPNAYVFPNVYFS